MRSAPPAQAFHPMLAREKVPSPGELERLLGARPATERPGGLREAIVRWLNEEL